MMIDHLYVPISSQPHLLHHRRRHRRGAIPRLLRRPPADQARCVQRLPMAARGQVMHQWRRPEAVQVGHGCRRPDKDAGELANYFGNVLSIPFRNEPGEEIAAMQLHIAADVVHGFLAKVATKEHFEGLIDWAEARRVEQTVARIYCNGKEEGPAFVVSGGMRFPVGKAEFGWGRPAFGLYHFLWGGDSGYVMPMPSAKGNGDWVVYVHLLKEQVAVVEAEAGHVFRPLTAAYLGLHQ